MRNIITEHRKLTVDEVLELKMADKGKGEQGELLNGIKVWIFFGKKHFKNALVSS